MQGTEAWIYLGHNDDENDDRMPGLSFMGDGPTKMEVEIEMSVFFWGGNDCSFGEARNFRGKKHRFKKTILCTVG